jgi:hypothetical protein
MFSAFQSASDAFKTSVLPASMLGTSAKRALA